MRITSVSDKTLAQAAEIIAGGGLVAFPTETVYGLGAAATRPDAVVKIFEAKNRPTFNPLISHCDSLEMAKVYAEFGDDALKIAEHFWPGPISLILKRRQGDDGICDLACAGLPTVAIRVPAHKTARDLIKLAGVPIAAPSANVSGSLSPTTAEHVAKSLQDNVDMILAENACQVGLESTILDVSGERPVLARLGGVTAEEIERVLEKPILSALENDTKPVSPGQLLKHYAPSLPVRLRAVDVIPGEALLAFGSTKFVGIRGGGRAHDLPDSAFRNLSESGDLYEAAANLFKYLHDLDKKEFKGIAVMDVPETGIGYAINDRLKRAANG